MSPVASSRKTASLISALVGVGVSALLVYLSVRRMDADAAFAAWRAVKPMPWVLVAALFYLAGHVVRGHRCELLVRGHAPLPLATATNVVVVGYASNNVLPARMGELVRAGLLAERTGIPVTQSLVVTFIERLLDGIAILMLLMIASINTTPAPWIKGLAEVGALIFGISALVLAVGAAYPSVLVSIVSRVTIRLGSAWHDRFVRLTVLVNAAASNLRRPRVAIPIFVTSIIVWLFESAMFASLFAALDLPILPLPAIIVMSVTNLGILAPSTPGFIGTFHYFCSEALIAQGVAPPVALAYAVIAHLTFFVPITIWGALAVLYYGVQVGDVAALARQARAPSAVREVQGVKLQVIASGESVEAPAQASTFMRKLVEALVAVPGEPPADPHIVDAAAQFTSDEIGALDRRLRVAFALGMLTFRIYTRLRFFRAFEALDLPRRQAAVNAWAYGRVQLFRQLFRPVRSLCLLAFHELSAEGMRGQKVPLRLVAHG
ncbi:MAG TPA: lysylphosphatidylglycerol synthase transmembrane domain-containing protein [Polyangiaceae bacterium]